MSHVTVAEAAFLCGKSRQTINKFTKKGKLSFSLNEEQAKVIDIAELQRVFPLTRRIEELHELEPANNQTAADKRTDDNSDQLNVLTVKYENSVNECEALRAERERERRQMQERIDRLEVTLEKTLEQHGRAMLLLTDQSGEGGDPRQEIVSLKESVQQLKQQNKRIYRELQEQKGRGLWKRLFG